MHTEPARDRSDALKREAAWKRLSRQTKLKRIGLSAALLLASGCPSSPSQPTTFTEINDQILQPTCAAFSTCHSTDGASVANHLDLSKFPYQALVNAPAVNMQAMSEGKVRVKPGDPDNSLMWIKLNLPLDASATDGYGGSMPSSDSPHLPDAQLQGIKKWILAGALNN